MSLKQIIVAIALVLTLLLTIPLNSSEGNLIGSSKLQLYKEFNEWMIQYGKKYQDKQELLYRFQNFIQNYLEITEHNQKYKKGESQFEMGINKFADLTNKQFRAKYTNPMIDATDKCTGTVRIIDEPPFDEDWSPRAVTLVKEQGSCSASWAFAAAGSLEGLYALTKGIKVNLSVQQLIDCSSDDTYGNKGCTSGTAQRAFWYTVDNGITSDQKYPYTGAKANCTYTQSQKLFSISQCANVKANSSKALESALIQQPVAVMVETGSLQFQFYKRGIFTGNCGNNIDNYMVLTGYGVLAEKSFWKCKNSWGDKWGDEGYIFLQRTKNEENQPGKCGIMMRSSVPLFD